MFPRPLNTQNILLEKKQYISKMMKWKYNRLIIGMHSICQFCICKKLIFVSFFQWELYRLISFSFYKIWWPKLVRRWIRIAEFLEAGNLWPWPFIEENVFGQVGHNIFPGSGSLPNSVERCVVRSSLTSRK